MNSAYLLGNFSWVSICVFSASYLFQNCLPVLSGLALLDKNFCIRLSSDIVPFSFCPR